MSKQTDGKWCRGFKRENHEAVFQRKKAARPIQMCLAGSSNRGNPTDWVKSCFVRWSFGFSPLFFYPLVFFVFLAGKEGAQGDLSPAPFISKLWSWMCSKMNWVCQAAFTPMLRTPPKFARHCERPLLFRQQPQNLSRASAGINHQFAASEDLPLPWAFTAASHLKVTLQPISDGLCHPRTCEQLFLQLPDWFSRSFSLPKVDSNVHSPVKQILPVVSSSTKEAQTRKRMLWQCRLSELNSFCSHPFIFFSMYVHRHSFPLIIIQRWSCSLQQVHSLWYRNFRAKTFPKHLRLSQQQNK